MATVVLIIAIAAVGWLCWALGQQVRLGKVVIIPMVAFTWLAIVMIVAVLVLDLSPWHLLWLLPVCILLAVAVVSWSWGLHLTMNFLALLAGPIPQPTPPTKKTRQAKKHRRGKRR